MLVKAAVMIVDEDDVGRYVFDMLKTEDVDDVDVDHDVDDHDVDYGNVDEAIVLVVAATEFAAAFAFAVH
jgi:hypothetical protein